MAVYSSSDEKIEFKEYENLEVKPSSEINTSIQQSPETVYSDLNLPELISDVRRLREEIQGQGYQLSLFI